MMVVLPMPASAAIPTWGMLNRLETAVPAGTQVVILQPGGNDERRGVASWRDANISQIVERLRDGRLPTAIQLSRLSAPEFHPPSHYPEFQALAQILLARRQERRAAQKSAEQLLTAGAGVQEGSAPPRLPLLIIAAIGLVALVGLLTFLSWLLNLA